MKKFIVPPWATGLREIPASAIDNRAEADIVAELASFRPVTSEKNVWAFWDKGFETIYPSYRRTVLNWVRRLSAAGWTIRVVDKVQGSPNHVYNYVGQDWFPACFVEGTMDGRHAAQHQSDLLRLPLLYEHGGVWMDVGNILFTHLDTLFWDHLADPDTPYEMAAWIITGQIRKPWGSFGNYMLAARRHCVFIKNWHNGFKALWDGRTNVDGFHALPLMQDIGLATGMEDWFSADVVVRMSDYVSHMLIGDRTRNLLDVETGWNGRDFFNTRVFAVEGIRNGILGALETNQDGHRQVELLTTRLDEPDRQKRDAAEAFVVKVLSESHMYKVYHNSTGGLPALGDLIKLEEFRDADHRTGTFGEMMRYGSVHWEQTRAVERLIPQDTGEDLIRAGVTEPAHRASS